MDNKVERFVELDSLRGIAALIVLLAHYTWGYDFHYKSLGQHLIHFQYGTFGVQIFFIISGFVIYMTIEITRSIKDFAIARLYPTYWFCLILTVLIVILFPILKIGNYTMSQVLLNFTMVHGYLKVKHVDQVYWTLGFELLFYINMACLLYFKPLKSIITFCIFWLCLCVASTLFTSPFENVVKSIFILEYALLFISGIAFYKMRLDPLNKRYLFLILIYYIINQISFYYMLSRPERQYEVTLTPFLLVTIACISFYLCINNKVDFLNNMKKNAILRYLGKISYPLYLLHNVIGYIIIYHLKPYTINQFLYCFIATLISIGLAALVSRYIEKPSYYQFKSKIHAIDNYVINKSFFLLKK